MSKLLLWLIMLPSALWRALGADNEQLRAILYAKLLMDNRKPLAFGGNKGVQRKKKKPLKNTSLKMMFLSLIMGFIYIFPMLLTKADVVLGLTLFYALFIVFMTFTLVTDFSNILIDTKDKFVLFSRPVDDRTVMLSRLLYIAVYLFRLVVPMSVPAWIIFGLMHGWLAAVWFIFPLILVLFMVLFFVCGMYLFIIRISKPGKFKDVLNYFQIGFSVVFFATWMLTSRMMNPDAIEGMDLTVFSWARWLPPYWVAASYTWIDPAVKVFPYTKLISILAVIVPLFSLYATVKWLAPTFVKKLSDGDSSSPSKTENESLDLKKQKNDKLLYRLLNLLNKDEASKAGFLITWLQTARSRTFKMRVYPSYAFAPVYFVYFFLNNGKSFEDVWREMPEGNSYIWLLYLTFFVILNALNYITMSDQYKAAWVYYSAPIEKPGAILAGAFKAMWVKYFLPFMIAISIFVVAVWGAGTLLDIAIATVNITLFTVTMMTMSYRLLPFSRKEQIKESGGKSVFRMFGVFAVIGLLGFIHFMLTKISTFGTVLGKIGLDDIVSESLFSTISFACKLVFLILSSIFLKMVFSGLKNTDWNSLKNDDADY